MTTRPEPEREPSSGKDETPAIPSITQEEGIDEAIDESFPASDPPSYAGGVETEETIKQKLLALEEGD